MTKEIIGNSFIMMYYMEEFNMTSSNLTKL